MTSVPFQQSQDLTLEPLAQKMLMYLKLFDKLSELFPGQ